MQCVTVSITICMQVHEKYQKRGKYPSKRLTPVHDIAIITLDTLITNLGVFPVCLPCLPMAGGQALIAGWGQTIRVIQAEDTVIILTHLTDKIRTCSEAAEECQGGDHLCQDLPGQVHRLCQESGDC